MGGTDGDEGYSITTDSGNLYITGAFQGTADFDPGSGVYNLTSAGGRDIFVSKIDASGNFVWAKAIGSSGHDYGTSVAIDSSGNVYTTGNFRGTADFDPGSGVYNLSSSGTHGDAFISKLDAAGNFVWARQFGAAGLDEGQSIRLDASGNVYTIGYFTGTIDFNPGVGTFNLTAVGICKNTSIKNSTSTTLL